MRHRGKRARFEQDGMFDYQTLSHVDWCRRFYSCEVSMCIKDANLNWKLESNDNAP
jgi:hypothetical protein